MVAIAATSPSSVPLARLRESRPDDLPFVLDSWRQSWRWGSENRRLRAAAYEALFDRLVRRGLFALPDTRVTVACDDVDDRVVLGWICATPGRLPLVHYAVVVGRRGVDLRRRGLLGVLLAAAGVATRLAYTFKPPDRRHRWDRHRFDLEAALIEGGRARGITAVYQPVESLLRELGA